MILLSAPGMPCKDYLAGRRLEHATLQSLQSAPHELAATAVTRNIVIR